MKHSDKTAIKRYFKNAECTETDAGFIASVNGHHSLSALSGSAKGAWSLLMKSIEKKGVDWLMEQGMDREARALAAYLKSRGIKK